MKRKQITAILMSAILTVSACVPMNSISAMAADKSGAGATEVAAEAAAAQEPQQEPAAEPTQEPAAEPAVEPTQEPQAEPAAEPTVEPQQPETTETGDTTGAAADGTTAAGAGATSEADTSAATEDAGNDATDDASAAATDAAADATDAATTAATDAAAASTTELEAEEDATVKKVAKSISDQDFATADNIAYGDTVTGTCNEEDPYAVYRFTPSKTAYYTFEVRMTDNGETLWGDVYDSDYERMYVGDITYLTPGSFDLRALLYEGSTYYFVAQMAEEWDTGSFDITVSSSLQVIDAADNTINVVPGGEVALIAEAYSLNDISYEWTFSTYNSSDIEATSHEASFTFTADYSGEAVCTVSDGVDEFTLRYDIRVNHLAATAIEESDENHYILVPAGETMDLHIDVTADVETGITYLWEKQVFDEEEGAWTNDYSFNSTDNNSITSDPVTRATLYQCLVSDQYGNSIWVFFHLNVENGFKAYIIPPNSTEIDENLHDAEIDFTMGEAITLEVGATANDPEGISYYWCNEWNSPLDGDTNTFVVEEPQNGEVYKCIVTDKYGTSITCTFTMSHHYLDAYADSDVITLDSGDWGYLQVYAESDEMIQYQWYFEDELMSGAVSDMLEVYGDRDIGTYKCIVSTEHFSRELIFHVLKDNHFNAYAVDSSYVQVEHPNDSVTLKVRVRGDDITGVTYQWYEDENGEDDNEAVPISGATSSSYTVPSVNSRVEYSCKATDKYGNTAWVYFYISINTHLKAYVAGTTRDYDTVYVKPGETVTLEVETTADDFVELTSEWSRRDTDGTGLLAQNVNTLEFTPDRSGNIYYSCQDQFGNSAYVEFEIKIDNGFDAIPEVWTTDGEQLNPDIDVREDDNAKFIDVYANVPIGKAAILKTNATADSGAETIDYSWINCYTDEEIEGAGSEVTVDCGPQVVYRCTLKDAYHNIIYIDYYIRLDNQFVAYPEGAPNTESVELYKKPGTQVPLKVVASALHDDRLTYRWESYNYKEHSYEDIPVTENSITVTVTTEQMEYKCIVSDGYTEDSRQVCFNVNPENNFVVYPEGAEVSPDGTYAADVYLNADPGEALDLHVNALADNTEGMTFHWEEEAKVPTIWGEYESQYNDIEGVSEDTHHITANKTKNYRCTVEDRYGYNRTVTFHVKVSGLEAHPEGAPVVDGYANNRIAITTQPSGTKTLRTIVYAPEGEPLTYKWTCGPLGDSSWWDDVDSSTNELTIDLSQPKRYLCVVTDSHDNQALAYFYVNAGGLTISAKADSNVIQPGLMGDNKYGVDVPVLVGDNVTLEAVVSGTGAENASYTWYTSHYDELGKTGSSINVKGYTNTYICEIVDQNGTKYTLVFHIKPDNQLQVKPAGEPDGTTEKTINTNPGEIVNLAVDISGKDISYVNYIWKDSIGREIAWDAAYSFKAEESGVYTCTVTDDYGTSKTVKFYVLTSEKTLDDAQITLSQIEFPSTGKPVKPTVKVVLDGTTLVNGRDYTVSYKNNIDPGTGSVIVTGIKVPGSRTLTFLIGKSSQTPVATPATVSVAVGKTATVTVADSHGALSLAGVKSTIATATLDEDKITVKGVNVGTYKLTVKAAGNDGFSAGQTTVTIYVVPGKTASVTTANANKGIKITWKKVDGATGYVIKRQAGSGALTTVKTITSGSTLTYTDAKANTNGTKYTYRVYAKAATGTSNLYVASVCYKVLRPTIKSATNSASKKMTVKWAKNAKANGYQIQYALKSNFSGAKSVPADKNSIVSKTIGGLTKGKKYYVRLRTYKKVGGKKYYSTWSATKTVVIKK